MSGIVCALRGGLHGQEIITHAVTLALETSLPVHFLYVVNRELVSDATIHSAHTVVEQLRQMGSSMVLVAQAVANSHGVHAQGAVRYGYVEDEITELCQAVDADYLILSQLHDHQQTNVFTPERLVRFRARIEKDARAKVVLAGANGP